MNAAVLNMNKGKGRRKLEDGGPKKEFVTKVSGSARKFVKWQDVGVEGAWRPLDQSGSPNSALRFSSKILNLYFQP